MKFKKVLALFLTVTMLVSFSTMFVTASSDSADYTKSWVNVGETIQISVGSGFSSVSWISNNHNIATVSETGEVTGVSSGIATIITNCKYANGNSKTFTIYITVYDNRGIVEGTEYNIMNAQTKTVLSLADKNLKSNPEINAAECSRSSLKQWVLTQQSTGLYTIENGYASAYMRKSSGMCVNSDVSAVRIRTLGSSKTHFEIRRINEEPYEGLYLICYGSKYLAATSDFTVELTSTLSSACYWSFSRVRRGDVNLIAFNYTNGDKHFDSRVANYDAMEAFAINSYSPSYFINMTSTDAKDLLMKGSVFIFMGHYNGAGGENGSLCFYKFRGADNGRIAVSENSADGNIYSIYGLSPNGSNALATLRCALYLSCNTAVDYGNTSLLEATYNEGAHFVLGTTAPVNSNDSTNFLEGFLHGVSMNYTVLDCVIEGFVTSGNNVDFADGSRGHYPAEYKGDVNQYLN